MMSINTNQVVMNIQFNIKPGMQEAFCEALDTLIEVMSNEPTFVNAIVSEEVDNPNIINLYEIWNHTKNSWMEAEALKPYRKDYENSVNGIIEDITISWLRPTREWGSNLTNTKQRV